MVSDIPPRRLRIPTSDIQNEQAKEPRLSSDTSFEQISLRLTSALRGLGIGVLDPDDDEDQPFDAQATVRDRRPTRH